MASKDDELREVWESLSENEKLALIAKTGLCLDGVEIPEDDEKARVLLLRTVTGDS